jgi:protein involved in polysaccharide export with SLBB domain
LNDSFYTRTVRFGGLALAALLTACANGPSDVIGDARSGLATSTEPNSVKAAPAGAGVATGATRGYVLGPGDKLRIQVFNEVEMSREYEVDSAGKVTLALIGAVQAAGQTPSDLQEGIQQALGKGYLRNPKVSVEVANYRPFYVIGEVTKAGEYPFKNGMNVISAVAVAGGYGYRANEKVVYIRRSEDSVERSYPASSSLAVNPGDIVRIPERLF